MSMWCSCRHLTKLASCTNPSPPPSQPHPQPTLTYPILHPWAPASQLARLEEVTEQAASGERALAKLAAQLAAAHADKLSLGQRLEGQSQCMTELKAQLVAKT